MDTLQPKSELETVNTMLVGAKDDLTRLKIQERFLQREVAEDKRMLQNLGQMQSNIKQTVKLMAFLEELTGELANSPDSLEKPAAENAKA